MLSLLRLGLGSGHEHHLSEKARLKEEERFESLQRGSVMAPDPAKRKRGKSAQSVHRPPKRSSKTGEASHPLPPDPVVTAADGDQDSSGSHKTAEAEPMEWSQVTSEPDATDQVNDEVSADRLARLKGVISRQFNLEILLKHNELRLIDQEIAKIQIALEQLRRCSVIPYPAMTSDANDILNVVHGKGVTAPPTPGMIPAAQPPPWGVTEGPYTRHYAKWLLPDPVFDGAYPESIGQASRAGKTIPERQTRGGKEISLPMTKPRPRAGFSRYQAVGAGTGEHEKTKGPMILKRALDGKLVKLVCSNCHREDFNSAQGFINHCRIAHSHNLASHEAAARECGQEIDPNEVVITASETVAHTTSTQPVVVGGHVHPMNRPQMPTIPKLSIPQPKRATEDTSPKCRLSVPASNDALGIFKPSMQVPHLSRLFAKLGKAVDLTAAVADATAKEPNTKDSEDESSSSGAASDMDEDEDEEMTPTHGMARIPSRISTLGGPSLSTGPNRPKSRKGPERAVRRPYTTRPKSTQITIPERKDTNDLSPNTITSINAPSLTSDSENASSEEDEDEYASDAHHKSASEAEPSDDNEDESVDVDMNHDFTPENTFGEDHASSSTADPELRASSKARSSHQSGTGSGRRGLRGGNNSSARRRGR